MRLSKNISAMSSNQIFCSAGRIYQSANQRISASSTDGTNQFALVAPGGLFYVPSLNEDAVVIPTESGRMCIGIRIPYNELTLEPGELMLRSEGGAYIILKNDGTVEINGKEF